jgi:hypothetical protein
LNPKLIKAMANMSNAEDHLLTSFFSRIISILSMVRAGDISNWRLNRLLSEAKHLDMGIGALPLLPVVSSKIVSQSQVFWSTHWKMSCDKNDSDYNMGWWGEGREDIPVNTNVLQISASSLQHW